jgi:hypothetical protein
LNDLINYFILGDILLLKSWQKEHSLPNDLATVFTTTDDVDKAVSGGILLPMTGINNYPYTIIFNLSKDTPELLKKESRLQFRKGGYLIKVENNLLTLFTWRILCDFNDVTVSQLIDSHKKGNKPIIEIENGWYDVEIFGGETLQEQNVRNVNSGNMLQFSDYEATFEFILTKTDTPEQKSADMDLSFTIKSAIYP